ncbi:three-Cys-motif partner protein TcmP [Notoacmeibacter marinus]|uniref:three-Cys-motif partner protein TcmP n=1 Tax=Notoacmeibacter marinus TaxID=1876515 RepID=UPI000DF33D97|nr:three-Cys-motif partner protein TcmP [Notoacmeibacter marinus]
MQTKPKHTFGGSWTEIKLDAISDYLNFYQNALKNHKFETWYVDAFAGTGERHAKILKGDIFQAAPLEEVEEVLAGSAKRALEINLPFAHYWFSEQRPSRVKALEALREEYDSDIVICQGDANEQLNKLFSSPPWASHRNSWKQRAVVFLDPYGMSVGFDTLKMLAETKRADVWYLFPRKAVIQQLANKSSGIDADKRASLTRIFGCEDWEERFYLTQPIQGNLFTDSITPESLRMANGDQIASFARERFREIFDFVSDPIPLLIKGHEFFELYCFSNNPAAIRLIKRGVGHVVKKYTPASRRKSFL